VVSLFFNLLLYSLKLQQGDEDNICWIASKRRTFEVRSFYYALSPPMGPPFPWKIIWRNRAPRGCLSTVGKTLILDSLRKRHVTM
jgi:hypothetical protein